MNQKAINEKSEAVNKKSPVEIQQSQNHDISIEHHNLGFMVKRIMIMSFIS